MVCTRPGADRLVGAALAVAATRHFPNVPGADTGLRPGCPPRLLTPCRSVVRGLRPTGAARKLFGFVYLQQERRRQFAVRNKGRAIGLNEVGDERSASRQRQPHHNFEVLQANHLALGGRERLVRPQAERRRGVSLPIIKVGRNPGAVHVGFAKSERTLGQHAREHRRMAHLQILGPRAIDLHVRQSQQSGDRRLARAGAGHCHLVAHASSRAKAACNSSYSSSTWMTHALIVAASACTAGPP